MDEWQLRPMRDADLDAIEVAERVIYEFPWSRGNFADSLAAGHAAWVAEPAGRLAGYAVMMMAVDEVELLNISVLDAWRRRGLGLALLDHLCQRARAVGARRMLLEVRPSNQAGRDFYDRQGFRQIGRRRDYYPAAAGREDALVMERML